MTQGDADTVERLYHRLAGALQQAGRGFGSPVTVAEIYQELVPYRLVRSDVGFGMNADYEHALLRLLSGEGGYVRMEPSHGTAVLRKELDSPNPNLGAYREFAGCEAFVSPPEDGVVAAPAAAAEATDWLEEVADDDGDVASEEDDWNALATLASDSAEASPSTFAFEEPVPPPTVQAAAPLAAEAPKEARCSFCDSTLPAHRPVRFCPFCGADQSTRPCAECGESLEAGWAFCVACGANR